MRAGASASLRKGKVAAVSRVVVIGATGHVGSYLVPRLVRAGHEVVALSRGEREPYRSAPEWRAVERVVADREAEDAAGRFGERIAALAADVVVDMLCFTPASARQLLEALRPARTLLLHCGSIWVHGPVARVPVTEDEPRTAYGEYGTGKAAIEALLQRETVGGGVPSVVLHPGHISGPWPSITPAGNLDLDVWRRLAAGEPLALPGLGLGVLHHVHADATREHIARGIAASIDRARDVLGYRPRFSSLDALRESLRWLVANGDVDVGSQDF
jgi:nucleoside-diphosphate-sugar epimerase